MSPNASRRRLPIGIDRRRRSRRRPLDPLRRTGGACPSAAAPCARSLRRQSRRGRCHLQRALRPCGTVGGVLRRGCAAALPAGARWAVRAGAAAAPGTRPDVALRARVRAAGPQADQRIDDERQRLELDLDLLDRFGRGQFVDRRHREDRLALDTAARSSRPARSAARRDALAEVAPAAAPGRSSAVRMALTPGIASAALGVDAAPRARAASG